MRAPKFQRFVQWFFKDWPSLPVDDAETYIPITREAVKDGILVELSLSEKFECRASGACECVENGARLKDPCYRANDLDCKVNVGVCGCTSDESKGDMLGMYPTCNTCGGSVRKDI